MQASVLLRELEQPDVQQQLDAIRLVLARTVHDLRAIGVRVDGEHPGDRDLVEVRAALEDAALHIGRATSAITAARHNY